jgi:ABC-2 type transport system permease protein
MTVILLRKLLHDIWLPLLVVALLLCAFECLWARVAQRITADLLPQLTAMIEKEQSELPVDWKDIASLVRNEGTLSPRRTHLIKQAIAVQGLVSPGAPSSIAPQAAVSLGVATLDASALKLSPLDQRELAELLDQYKGLLPLVQKKLTDLLRSYQQKRSQKIGHDIQKMVFEGPGKIVQSLIGAEKLDLMRVQDTLSVGFVHPLVQVILCIWAIGRAAGAISGELDRGTMELLLAQPVPRRTLVLAQLWVDLLTIPVLCLSLWGGVCLGAWLSGLLDGANEMLRAEPLAFAPALLNVAVLIFAVSGATMFLSSLGRFRSRVLGLAVLLFLIQFLVNLIGQIWDDVAFLRPATVFYYYQPQAVILDTHWAANGTIWLQLAVLLAVGAVGYLLALWCFCRRDLPAPL